MVQENPYLQYFCGYSGYDDERLPFDPSLMVYFRKRLTPEVLGETIDTLHEQSTEKRPGIYRSKARKDSLKYMCSCK